MSLKKTFKTNAVVKNRQKAQSVLEYALLVAVAIIAFVVGVNFVINARDNAFNDHFKDVASGIANQVYY